MVVGASALHGAHAIYLPEVEYPEVVQPLIPPRPPPEQPPAIPPRDFVGGGAEEVTPSRPNGKGFAKLRGAFRLGVFNSHFCKAGCRVYTALPEVIAHVTANSQTSALEDTVASERKAHQMVMDEVTKMLKQIEQNQKDVAEGLEDHRSHSAKEAEAACTNAKEAGKAGKLAALKCAAEAWRRKQMYDQAETQSEIEKGEALVRGNEEIKRAYEEKQKLADDILADIEAELERSRDADADAENDAKRTAMDTCVAACHEAKAWLQNAKEAAAGDGARIYGLTLGGQKQD
jgi:predicted XRE-type DNA-binding protein